ncbi:hypothetical protein [Leeuwenhoekiella sp. NPDC079379]|uniref:hypothetical protein n=1 Tax=Leeuwenhoekiella sp. NPDC079379 TaxID=3364122 RepID=UPI0037C95E0E
MQKTFALIESFNKPLDKTAFFEAKEKYCTSIRTSSFSMLENTNLIELIETIKRTLSQIGPYKDLTPFEALNRIGSDLVLLAGAEKIFNNEIPSIKPKTILLNMGNKAGYDVIIETDKGKVYGEAFNAAKSFCKVKMRESINKLLESSKSEERYSQKQRVIFYNEDITDIIEAYTNKKEKATPGVIIHKIPCNYKEVVDFKDR